MHRKLFFLISFTLLFTSCGNNDVSSIKEVFNKLNSANMNKDGEGVYNYTDQETHDYYQKLLQLVLYADSVETTNLSLLDYINVFTARAVIPDSILATIDVREFMIKMYSDANNIDEAKRQATAAMQLKNVKVDGNTAKGELCPSGRSMPEPIYIKFVKEEEEWKYNIISIMEFTEKAFYELIQNAGMTRDDLVQLIFSDPFLDKKMIKTFEELDHAVLEKE